MGEDGSHLHDPEERPSEARPRQTGDEEEGRNEEEGGDEEEGSDKEESPDDEEEGGDDEEDGAEESGREEALVVLRSGVRRSKPGGLSRAQGLSEQTSVEDGLQALDHLLVAGD